MAFSFFAVVPSLLVPLCSPISAVRKSAIACLKTLKSQLSPVQACPVTALIDALIDNAEEVSADPEQLHRFVVMGWFMVSSLPPALSIDASALYFLRTFHYLGSINRCQQV